MVEVLITAGFHVPLMPLLEVVGNAGAVLFWHNGPICVNVGVICELITTSIVAGIAHCPLAGVKVYVAGDWLLISEGLHVPVIPLLEVVGSEGAAAPEQTDSVLPKVKAGVWIGLTVTLNTKFTRHCPGAGSGVKR